MNDERSYGKQVLTKTTEISLNALELSLLCGLEANEVGAEDVLYQKAGDERLDEVYLGGCGEGFVGGYQFEEGL